jgi:hypothetical protein
MFDHFVTEIGRFTLEVHCHNPSITQQTTMTRNKVSKKNELAPSTGESFWTANYSCNDKCTIDGTEVLDEGISWPHKSECSNNLANSWILDPERDHPVYTPPPPPPPPPPPDHGDHGDQDITNSPKNLPDSETNKVMSM